MEIDSSIVYAVTKYQREYEMGVHESRRLPQAQAPQLAAPKSLNLSIGTALH